MQPWLIAIAVILVLQTTSAFLTRLVPIASPAFMAEFGWDEIWVGYLAAANIIGALFVLFTCIGLILRIGGVRALQISLLIGAASLLLLHVPSLALAAARQRADRALSNGAANPAGSEVLQRFTPPARRNFVFSIKQAGVPLGGVVAGLAIPPLIEALGWRTALLLAAAAAAVVTLAMWPFRPRIDAPRRGAGPGLAAPTFNDLAVPLRSLIAGRGLMRMALVGTALSVAQACWFTFAVTYLVVGLGHSLSVAGLVFAIMQATSVIGRIVVGWIADRAGSSTMTIALAPSRPRWRPSCSASPAPTGRCGRSLRWRHSRASRCRAGTAFRSPRWRAARRASWSARRRRATSSWCSSANMLAPVAFAAFVAATGRFDLAFMIAGACSLVCLPLLWGLMGSRRMG